MSCLAYEIVGTSPSTGEKQDGAKASRIVIGSLVGSKDLVGSKEQEQLGDRLARIAARVLDCELAQGSMPA